MTQREVAELAGISEGHVRRLERGAQKPGGYTLLKLADALHTAPELLL